MPEADGQASPITVFSIAEHYLGVGELPGDQDHPLIRWWLAESGGGLQAHDEIPWCSAFCAAQARLARLPIPEHPLRARSWLTVGKPIELGWAAVGWDVVILMRGGGGQPGPDVLDAAGHVGFFAGWGEPLTKDATSSILVLGGNQSNRVTTERYPISRLLGVRRLRT